MKALSANPQSVQELFRGHQYVIPAFQRPYTWGETQCVKLWDDLLGFFEKWKCSEHQQDEKYFLGTIVVYPDKNRIITRDSDVTECLGVIDGQQRLTTLTLLMSAFACHNKGYKALNKLIRVVNCSEDCATDELRLITQVLEDSPLALDAIVKSPNQGTISRERIGKNEASRVNNFVLFREKINDWYVVNGRDAEKLNALTGMLLKNVVVLPIHCDSVDDAFQIFEVVNNRGKPLAEADIFKSDILQKLGTGNDGQLNDKQKSFLKDWKLWCEAKQEDFIFRALMRIKNAQEGNIDTTDIAIRQYFQEKHREHFKNPEKLIADLEKIFAITQWKRPDEVAVLWRILECYPNEAWKWPLVTYLFVNGEINVDGSFILPSELIEPFIGKIREMTRYCFAKNFAGHGSLNALKGDSYKECARVYRPDDARFSGGFSATAEECAAANARLNGFMSESCYRAGFQLGAGVVLLCSYLLHRADMKMFANFVDGGQIDIEHICPKNWSNVDGWDEDTHERLVNTIGNLVPLEKSINIQVSNMCFEKKKTGQSIHGRGIVPYIQSQSPEARALGMMTEKHEWLPKDVEENTARKIAALRDFLGQMQNEIFTCREKGECGS